MFLFCCRLWVLRRALASTVQYEADSLLADLSLRGHRTTFVSLAEPLGAPSPLEVGKDILTTDIASYPGHCRRTSSSLNGLGMRLTPITI